MPKRTINLTFPSGTDLPEKDIAAYKLFLGWLVKKIGIKSESVNVSLVSKSAEKGCLSHHEFSDSARPIITIFVRQEGRAMIDILRSLAHEFQHLKQHEAMPYYGFPLGRSIDESVDWKNEADAASVSGQLIKKFMADHNECRWIYKY